MAHNKHNSAKFLVNTYNDLKNDWDQNIQKKKVIYINYFIQMAQRMENCETKTQFMKDVDRHNLIMQKRTEDYEKVEFD